MKLSDIRWLVKAVQRYSHSRAVDGEKYRRLYQQLVTDIGRADAARRGHDYNPASSVGWSKAYTALIKLSGVEEGTVCGDCHVSYPYVDGTDGTDDIHFQIESHSENICVTCQANYSFCQSCEEWEHQRSIRSFHGDVMCSSCYEDQIVQCDDCSHEMHRDDADRYDGEYYCSDCYQSHSDEEEDEDVEGDYGRVQAPTGERVEARVWGYSADVTEVFTKPWLGAPGEATDKKGNGRSKTPTLWMGFELEVRARTQTAAALQEAVKAVCAAAQNRAILKEDSSIGGRGFEIVSLPGTLNFHQTQWGEEFWKALTEHTSGWGHDSCGMHVHISRAALTHLQLGRMVTFLSSKNRAFIEKIAGRGEVTYCRVLDKKITDVRRQGADTRNAVNVGYGYDDAGKYQAINLGKAATAEIRIFRSNVSRYGFLKNVEFCDALANFCRVAGNNDLNRDAFLSWMSEHRGTYPFFIKWATREGLMTTRHVADPKAEPFKLTA